MIAELDNVGILFRGIFVMSCGRASATPLVVTVVPIKLVVDPDIATLLKLVSPVLLPMVTVPLEPVTLPPVTVVEVLPARVTLPVLEITLPELLTLAPPRVTLPAVELTLAELVTLAPLTLTLLAEVMLPAKVALLPALTLRPETATVPVTDTLPPVVNPKDTLASEGLALETTSSVLPAAVTFSATPGVFIELRKSLEIPDGAIPFPAAADTLPPKVMEPDVGTTGILMLTAAVVILAPTSAVTPVPLTLSTPTVTLLAPKLTKPESTTTLFTIDLAATESVPVGAEMLMLSKLTEPTLPPPL